MRAILLAIFLTFFGAAATAAETQKVCIDQKDPKTQKTQQVCKQVKVHKKLEGTKVPAK